MKSLLVLTFILANVLSACGGVPSVPGEDLAPAPSTLAVAKPTSLRPTETPQPTVTYQPVALPLSGPGPYSVGMRGNIEYIDPARQGRKVTITIWYPVEKPAAPADDQPVADAAPDRTDAPYPLVLSSTKAGFFFAPHLASYGFVIAGINGQDAKRNWGQWLIDYPLDITFSLDQIASKPIEGLDGMIDADRAGTLGYSFDAYSSLALSGARIDPQFYRAQCATATSMEPAPPDRWLDYICNMPEGWDAFVANAGPAIASNADELWKPLSDPRIRAVMPMAPEGAWLFGTRGLAEADRSVLIIAAGQDTVNIYEREAAYIFDHLGSPDKAMISFLGQDHMMIDDPAQLARMRHFAAAFFGVKLQHNEDFAKYLSEAFVGNYQDLAWVPRKDP